MPLCVFQKVDNASVRGGTTCGKMMINWFVLSDVFVGCDAIVVFEFDGVGKVDVVSGLDDVWKGREGFEDGAGETCICSGEGLESLTIRLFVNCL